MDREPDRFTDDLSHTLAWLRHFGAAVLKGERESIVELNDGRARVAVVYPSLGEALDAAQQVDGLKAMIAEDSASLGADERLTEFVRRYHEGDDDGCE